jgi:NADPH:quinone reductase-like Zn-dependent oxidoreductase
LYVGSGEMFAAMNRAIGHHQMRPTVDRIFEMQEIRDALRYMESGQHFGKIVITA